MEGPRRHSPGHGGLAPFHKRRGPPRWHSGLPRLVARGAVDNCPSSARRLQDPVHGSRLFPYLPIEIRRVVTTSLTEPAQMLHSHAYAIIILQTWAGPHPLALLVVYVNDQRRLVAMPLPDLDDGDPCAHCPGWHRFWHNKLHRPFWHHPALGGPWRRPDGWRGTNYSFPFIVLARRFRDWWRLAAFEGLCQTVCYIGFHHRGLLTVMRNGDGSDKVVTRRGRTYVRCSIEKVSRYDTRTRGSWPQERWP